MPSRRVAVTSPQTRLAHARRRVSRHWRAPRLDRAEADRARTLYRAQRWRGVTTLVLLFTWIFGLPVVFAVLPVLDDLRLFDVPASWLALVLLPFPVMVLLARWHLRRAERVEDV